MGSLVVLTLPIIAANRLFKMSFRWIRPWSTCEKTKNNRKLIILCFFIGSQLDELQKMNLVPQTWLLRIYSQHYHAVCPILSFYLVLCSYRVAKKKKKWEILFGNQMFRKPAHFPFFWNCGARQNRSYHRFPFPVYWFTMPWCGNYLSHALLVYRLLCSCRSSPM